MSKKNKISKLVSKGQILLKESPFVYILKSSLKHERCDFCFLSGKVQKCSACKYVSYCNKNCQVMGWEIHKDECMKLKRISPRIVPDAARILARLIFKLKKGGDKEKRFYTETNFRVFKDLMSHYSDIKEDMKRMEHFTSLYNVLLDYLGEDSLPNSAELLGIYGRLVVNGFNILDPEMIGIGSGIYLGVSVIDHSCDPTAVAVFQGTTIFIRSLVDMPQFDWSKVFISYIELLNNTKDRQRELMETYYFLCECSRCKDIEELKLVNSIKCPNTRCYAPVAIQPKEDGSRRNSLNKEVICSTCGEMIKPELCKQYEEVYDFVSFQLQSMKNFAYWDICKVCLEKQGELFHPLNLQRVKVLDCAFESCVTLGNWREAKHYGVMLLPGYKMYYGMLHPLTGLLQLKLAKICVYLEQMDEASQLLHAAEKILLITHGNNHPLFVDHLLPLSAQLQLTPMS